MGKDKKPITRVPPSTMIPLLRFSIIDVSPTILVESPKKKIIPAAGIIFRIIFPLHLIILKYTNPYAASVPQKKSEHIRYKYVKSVVI